MSGDELSDSESEENVPSEEESDNVKSSAPRNEEKVPAYEMQRLKRIEENKRRMEALGLPKMATSFMGSVEKVQKKKYEKKGKKKMVDEDEEYNPTQDDEGMSSSGEEDEDFSVSGKKKVKSNTSTPKKRGTTQKHNFELDDVDDDDALMQAITLSLQGSAGFLDVKSKSPRSSGSHLRKTAFPKTPGTKSSDKIEEKLHFYENSGNKKRKKPITSRVQMSEDEMLVNFFQFDESDKGGISTRDIERLAIAHDFTWTEKEIADMIYCFDSDGDWKISLDDFRKIVGRCNMLRTSDKDATG